MNKWLIENNLGFFPPFILPRRNAKVFRQHHYLPDCSVYFLHKLILYEDTPIEFIRVQGVQHDNYHVPNIVYESELKLVLGDSCYLCKSPEECTHSVKKEYHLSNIKCTRTINHNCYLNTTLYIQLFNNKEFRLFKAEFNGCRAMREKIEAYEIFLFDSISFVKIDSQPACRLILKVINYKNNRNKGAMHYSWADSKRPEASKPLDVKIQGVIYKLNSTVCIFCFKEYSEYEYLIRYLKHHHINYKVLCMPDRSGLELVYDENVEKLEFSPTFQYIRKGRRRRNTESQASAQVGEKVDPGWLYFLTEKRLDEIIDLPKNKIGIMKEWNCFYLKKKMQRQNYNLRSLVIEFIKERQRNRDLMDFLLIFYYKAVFSLEEILNILNEIK